MLFLLLLISTATAVRVAPEPTTLAGAAEGWEWMEPVQDMNQPLSLQFALRHTPEAIEQLKTTVDAVSMPSSPRYGAFLTADEVRNIVMNPQAVSTVLQFAHAHGMAARWMESGDVMEIQGSLSQFAKMLDVEWWWVQNKDGDRVVRMGPPSTTYTLPQEVADAVELVVGLIRLPATPLAVTSLPTDGPDVTPALIRKRYNVTLQSPKAATTQCVVSFLGQFIDPDDVALFEETFKIPSQEVAKWVGPNNASVPGVEASLDIEYLMGINQMETWVWSTPGENEFKQEPFWVWLQDVIGKDGTPDVFSISYQDMEDTLGSEYMERVDREFQKLASMGKSVFTGSGDWGTQCTQDGTHFRADFPSSAPHITSTGATEFLGDGISEEGGVSWSSGGFSLVFDQPSWQKDAVDAFLKNTRVNASFFRAEGRAFPDLSTIGVNFQIVVNGKQRPVGGTSAATPTAASMISLLNAARLAKGKPTMGWVNPWLYQMWAERSDAFYDVTHGNNRYAPCPVGFDAIPGWDAITGLGTPNWSVWLEEALK